MTKEIPQPPSDCIQLKEQERLWGSIHHLRLLQILNQPEVVIHAVQEDTNTFGEYLFVTVSCGRAEKQECFTFYGLGYHEYRERWITDTWQWYESRRNPQNPTVSKIEALKRIEERVAYCQRKANTQPTRSKRAELYNLMADLTDEDGALSDLEDMGGWLLGDDDM